jgi:hypothetical protein
VAAAAGFGGRHCCGGGRLGLAGRALDTERLPRSAASGDGTAASPLGSAAAASRGHPAAASPRRRRGGSATGARSACAGSLLHGNGGGGAAAAGCRASPAGRDQENQVRSYEVSPIFAPMDYGIVGDLNDVVPAAA